MRNPYNLNYVECDNQTIEYIKIDKPPVYDIEDYDLFDDKDFAKYIKRIKDLVRHSFEYKQLVNFLRDNMQMNKCSMYENVSNENNYKIKIHVHHEPFTLEDIVLIVYRKRCYYREDITPEMVAKEILYLHYKFLVGLIPLAETVHELVHNNYLFVPCNKVLGNFDKFAEIYDEFLDVEQKETLATIKEFTEAYNFTKPEILNKKYIYIDTSSEDTIDSLPTYQEIIDAMSKRIDYLKEANTRTEPEKELISPITYHKKD